ncbi:ribonuclease domain-containing protein [uncultured Dechloromonas sp.]|uniref:ribonuclease domain-containing protein n=1 Tax=uncultured Dechloromonas sp. TaxID=171719 RepID=UPI0025CF455C|nr:ribonuclease domain-containing protein [uncultured Dechloromonas sp.]
MPTWLRFLLVLWLAVGSAFAFSRDDAAIDPVAVAELPREARQTLALIKDGGPFPYDRDGIVFGNFEKRLPLQARGYYREYTVKSPWRRDRGPRRIIAGERGEYFYTDDHYRTFRRIKE